MIQKSSLIVSLSMSQWSARKLDKKITEEVRDQHSAAQDAGRYNKLLVSKQHMEDVQKAVSSARTFHYENTLPWGDNNERLLPAKNYFEYVTEIAKLKRDFEYAVEGFIQNYDTVIQEARVRLNGMFREADYPSRADIVDKFGFKTTFMPVPENDFRLELSQDEIDKLKGDVEVEIGNRLRDAVSDIWTRIKEQLTHMKVKLRDDKAIFRDSLFENLKELVQLLPKLNVTDDPNLNLVCTEMAGILTSPEAVRANPDLRQIKADEVEKVLNQFNQFFPS